MYHKLLTTMMLIMALLLAACGGQSTGQTDTTGSSAAASTAASAPAASAPAASEAAASAPAASEAAASGAAPGGGGAGLDAIKQRGKLIAGVKYDQPGFGFLNPATNKVEGFDVDIAREVAKKIFGDENAIEFKEAISKNRIPYLENGTVDIVAATMTANEERAKQIDFSDTYYVAGQSLLVKKDSPIKSIDDLKGKTVATAKGSTSEKNIRAKAPEANVELYDTYADGVQALQSGRADAVTTDDIILYGFQSQNADLQVVGGQFTKEPYAIGVKKGNEALLEQVNAALREIKQSGRWAEIYKKWIPEQQVPPVPPQDWREVK